MNPLLEVTGLTKRFPLAERDRFVQACHEVSFTIAPGETLGLVGESGSGKTTVGRLLVRLIDASEGEIIFDGRRIEQLPHRQVRPLRAEMQIVFQEPGEALNARMTVEQLISEPMRLHGIGTSRRDRAGKVLELLDQAGLSRRVAHAQPAELSAGNQQRVAIARALATNPRFIVLDEPTSSLPADATEGVLQLLRDLQSELDLSYLFISHDLSLVRHFCDRVAVMYLGQIVEIGPLRSVFDDPQHPYSRALLASVLRVDTTERRADRGDIVAIQGEIPSPVDLPDGCYLAGRCPEVRDRCRAEPQRLVQLTDRREVRCHRVVEGDLVWDGSRSIPEHME